MNTTKIQIKPVTYTATELNIFTDYALNQPTTFHYTIKGENSLVYDQGIIRLSEEEFAAWGDNDAYIENLILTKLGLKKA
jgi:hypothetical protein